MTKSLMRISICFKAVMPTSEVLSVDFFSNLLHPFFLKRFLHFSNVRGTASDKLHTRPQSVGLHRLVALGCGEREYRTP